MKKSRTAIRAIDILELISNEKKGLTLSEIAKTLGIPVTSVSDIIGALLEKEMIEVIDERSKVYGIGVNAFFIGNAFISNTSLIDKSKDIIEKLGVDLNKTVFLGKEVNERITYIYKYEPKSTLITTCAIGARTPIHCTSLGKSIMAHDNELMKKVLNKELKKNTPFTITDHDLLKAEIDKIRKNGYAVDNREQSEHLLCIGAPIFDNNNKVIASISVSGLYSKDIDIEKQGTMVRKSALEISKKMGYNKE